jgi:hypothetical protein
MRLRRARVQNYRCIKDTGWFDVDATKTILVGPNEGGKTALLKALEQLNPGRLARSLDPLRDFPRSEYHRIQDGSLWPADLKVAEGEYELDDDERSIVASLSPAFASARYYRAVRLDNSIADAILDAPAPPSPASVNDSVTRIAAVVASRQGTSSPPNSQIAEAGLSMPPADQDRDDLTLPDRVRSLADAERLRRWLGVVGRLYIGPEDEAAPELISLSETAETLHTYLRVLEELRGKVPVMVYVSTYPSVTSLLHLGHLADAIEAGAIEETDEANFGNVCLLRLLNFSARELSDMGRAQEPDLGDTEGFERYRAQLDEREAALGTASLKLTNHLRDVWHSSDESSYNETRDRFILRVTANQQYLKVVVEDSQGVQIELDQRSDGFKWLVSFFVVFFAQAAERSREAILLLDEPGLTLHGLKQREFRRTLSKLGESNQLLFTTHSPFLVGSNELDLVRIVEVMHPATGTRVSMNLEAEDPASLVPLQEAVSYDLATSLFSGQKVLITEDLADYWFLEATAALLADAGMAALDRELEVMPAGNLTRIAYFPTLLHAEATVAALLDSDAAGPHGEEQDRLVDRLGYEQVIRTKDAYEGPIPSPRIEELLRETLLALSRDLGWDGSAALDQEGRPLPIGRAFTDDAGFEVSRYRLAKEYVNWTRDHRAFDLTADERVLWMRFLERVNKALA